VAVRKATQRLDQEVERRQQHAAARVAEHSCVREVVDVFRGTREMDELERALHLAVARQALLQPVLDRLDVVVGAAFDRLDSLRVASLKRATRRSSAASVLRENGRSPLIALPAASGAQPGQLDLYPVAMRADSERVCLRGSAARAYRPSSGESAASGEGMTLL
jgi:hypothetical protein